MKISDEGIKFIEQFEGCKLQAYKCPAGVVTIGIGCTYYENNEPIKMGDVITKERAIELFKNIVTRYEKIVNNMLKTPVNQNQFDALVSHVYNCGTSNTLFSMVNAKDSNLSSWWISHYITANNVKLNGLIKRRIAEKDLYFKNV